MFYSTSVSLVTFTKVKRIRNYALKYNLYPYFLIWQKLLISGAKILMSTELNGGVSRSLYVFFELLFFELLFWKYNCAKFDYCRIGVTDFRQGGSFRPPAPYLWAAQKRPTLNRVKREWHQWCKFFKDFFPKEILH